MDMRTLEGNPTTWKWVLFVCSALFIIPNLSAFPRVNFNFGIIVSAINLVALYGLAYEKAIWSRTFWKVFFWVFVTIGTFAIIFISLAVGNITNQLGGGLITGPAVIVGNLIVLLLILLFFGVQVRGVYLYSYKRESLWSQEVAGD